MTTLTVQLPESLQRSLQAFAEREGCSVDRFLARAAAEKLSAVAALDFLRREAAQGNRQDFESLLAAVPPSPVPESDRVPGESTVNA